MIWFGDCAIDPARRELRRGGALVHVEPQVFDLLVFLIENRERVVTKDDLFDAIWKGRIVSDTTLSSRINSARRAIGDAGGRQSHIQTIPRRGFRFVAEVGSGGTAAVSPAVPASDTRTLPAERPSIAVLPFSGNGAEPNSSYFAFGMAEGLITSLSHIRWLEVIARSSSFRYDAENADPGTIARDLDVRYVLRGSARKSKRSVRVAVQLLEAETGKHLWSDHFDGDLSNVFDLQDRIAASLAGAIEPPLRGAEIARAKRKPPGDLDAYDLYLRALPHAYAYTAPDRTEALVLLNRALAIDPDYVEAHGLAAWCHVQRIWAESAQSAADLAKASAHARRVMALRTDDASTLAFAANAHARTTLDYETALQLIEHALSVNPSSAHAQAVGAIISAWLGRYEAAIALAEKALRYSPFDPVRHLALAGIARSNLFLGKPTAARTAAARAVQASPGHLPSYCYLMVSLARLGATRELGQAVERLLENVPGARLAQFAAHPMFEPFIEELSRVGLPD